ncbi:MAG TPA: MFS transporter [Candidatus Eisenbacteria bacterium]|nr:MFS transporter [Candidatus Eisenbacteria bacterium]
MSAAGAVAAPARGALAVPGFRRLWLAGGISAFGDSFTALALLVVLLRLTGSTAAVAGLLIVTGLPQIVLGLQAGVVADRLERRRLMVASELVRGAFVLGLVAVRAGRDAPWLYALAVAQAAVGVFFEPARAAFVPRLVPPELRLSANALDQTLRLVAATTGSALAGLLLGGRGGPALAFSVDAGTFVASAALIAGIAAPAAASGAEADATPEAAPGGRGWQTLGAGLQALLARRALLGLLLTFAVATVGLGFMNVAFVPFVLADLHASTTALGLVRAAQTLGIAAGGACVGWLGARLPARGLVVGGVGGLGLGFAAMAWVPGAGPLFALMPLLGVASSALQAGSTTLLQAHAPDALRGRIESALDTLLVTLLMAAMAAAGALARGAGERRLFLAAGALTLLGGLVGAAAIPGRRAENR